MTLNTYLENTQPEKKGFKYSCKKHSKKLYATGGVIVAATIGGFFISRKGNAFTTWNELVNAGSPRTWNSVASADDGLHLAAVAGNGYVYTSSNGGQSWNEVTFENPSAWADVAMSDDGSFIAAAPASGYIFTSSDYGVTWVEQHSSLPPQHWKSIAVSANGGKLIGVVGGGVSGHIYTSNDSGATWEESQAIQTDWQAVAMSDDGNEAIAASAAGYVFTSTDSGVNWAFSTPSLNLENWKDVTVSADGQKMAAAVYSGSIFLSDDAGATWRSANITNHNWNALSTSENGIYIAAAELNGDIYISVDEGETWDLQTNAGARAWGSLAFSSDGSRILAGDTAGSLWGGNADYDTVDPEVSVTSPTEGGRVDGSSVTITANATDNIGIEGVAFYINGELAGTEDVTEPYTYTFDSTTLSDGGYSVIAVARDAAANYATSTTVNFVIDNSASVISAITAGVPSSSGITISWNTNEETTSQIEYGTDLPYTASSTLDSTYVGTHSITLGGLSPETTYHYRVISKDSLGHIATSSDQTFTTTKYVPAPASSESAPQTSGSGYSSGGFGAGASVPAVITSGANTTGVNTGNVNPINATGGAQNNTSPSTGVEKVSLDTIAGSDWVFTRNTSVGVTDNEIMVLQKYLNANGFIIATNGAGSPGKETNYFGALTRAAVARFQKAVGITPAIGYFGPITRRYIENR